VVVVRAVVSVVVVRAVGSVVVVRAVGSVVVVRAAGSVVVVVSATESPGAFVVVGASDVVGATVVVAPMPRVVVTPLTVVVVVAVWSALVRGTGPKSPRTDRLNPPVIAIIGATRLNEKRPLSRLLPAAMSRTFPAMPT
jgi:hypothetical protein